jgi:hypothetical protein
MALAAESNADAFRTTCITIFILTRPKRARERKREREREREGGGRWREREREGEREASRAAQSLELVNVKGDMKQMLLKRQ